MDGSAQHRRASGRLSLGAVMTLAALVLPASPATGGGTSCQSSPATIVGTSGADYLVGTNSPDVIVGRGGPDEILGRGGDDTICPGAGYDTLRAGEGDDRVIDGLDGGLFYLGSGDDTIQFNGTPFSEVYGGTGADRLQGYLVRGGDGPDQMYPSGTGYGDDGADVISGSFEANRLFGGEGDDDLEGLGGNDDLAGGTDDDYLFGGSDADDLIGGSGSDFLDGGNPGINGGDPDMCYGGDGFDDATNCTAVSGIP